MGFQERFQERVIPAADRVFSISAVLTHGAVASDPFNVTWEDQRYDVMDAEGFLTQFHSRDFMFDVSGPVVAGEPIKPRAGDTLEVTENNTVKKYELLPIGKADAAELMPGDYRWKVHTKRVA